MSEPAQSQFAGAGGRTIKTYHWLPDADARDQLVVLHGYAEHAGRYQAFAEFMNARGFAVHALDHHGHGRSDGKRAVIESFEAARADIDRLIEKVRVDTGLDRIKLVGHSMGGSLALEYALHHEDKLSGLILSGPAIGGGVGAASGMFLRLLSKIAPEAGTIELDSSAISRDPAVVEAYRNDPLVTLGKVPARTANSMMQAIAGYPAAVGKLTVPCLLMHGRDDKLVPLRPVEPVFEAIGSRDKTIRIYDGLYHEIFNEPEREAVLGDVVDWLEAHPPA